MSLLWPALAVLAAVAGVAALRRGRGKRKAVLSDEEIARLERGGSIERREPLDLDEIAEAERRHREQTWDWEDPDGL